MPKSERVVITVLGKDRVGIVAGISGVLADNNVNILDLASTKMRDLFVMVLLADLEQAKVDIHQLRRLLEKAADELGVQVLVHHEDVFKAMHRV